VNDATHVECVRYRLATDGVAGGPTAVRRSSVAQRVTQVAGRPTGRATTMRLGSRAMSAAGRKSSARARSQMLASKGLNIVKPGKPGVRVQNEYN